jgi:hypothetical protein
MPEDTVRNVKADVQAVTDAVKEGTHR